ncbi:MAG TPA: dienelactone hydrolase family protein [Pseudonocardiaceae bacterium]|jgi:carboxymethylenebutenolidase|nr:dienelactone hydrolase family protein [Pseudonocardiaceae bacterium]
MCHSDDSRPPAPPIAGEVASAGPVELTSADGTRFRAFQATPATPNGRAMIVLPDIRGLHPYYEELATRFAEAGFHAVAIDYFGRTAGLGDRGDDFDWQQHVPKVVPADVVEDARAALSLLRESTDGPVFTVGYCFGGSHSWRLAASDLDIAGAIGFYGRPSMVEDVLADLRRPLLMLIAGADQVTSAADFDALEARLTALDKEHEMRTYEGAPHSFFDRGFAEWADACADAWERMLAFTGVA